MNEMRQRHDEMLMMGRRQFNSTEYIGFTACKQIKRIYLSNFWDDLPDAHASNQTKIYSRTDFEAIYANAAKINV